MTPHPQRIARSLVPLALAAAGLGLLPGCASSPAGGHLAQFDLLLRGANSANAVALAVTPPQVRLGETVALQIGSAQPGYLYVYQISSEGQTLSLVFPNAIDGANRLPGGAVTTTLPRPTWRMTAKGPAGIGYFLAVVSQQPQDLNRIAAGVAQNSISVDGAYGAAMATLREVTP